MVASTNENFPPVSLWVPKMIVFDKDGTLGDCSPSLKNWCYKMTNEIEMYCQRQANLLMMSIQDIVHHFHSAIGWDTTNDCLTATSSLSADTWEKILETTVNALNECNVDCTLETVTNWHANLGDVHANDKPLGKSLPSLMKSLRQQGLLIAVCTSDDRKATDACMRAWDLEGLIDFSICGDEVVESKPSAQPLLSLCRDANVLPTDCVVVGDTHNDTGMGKNSGAGLVIGVLSGSGTSEELLKTGAHVILPNVDYIPGLLNSVPTRTSNHDTHVETWKYRIRTKC